MRPAQEGQPLLQIESITFSWCSMAKALALIRDILAGHYDQADYRVSVTPRLQSPEKHGHCHLCQ